MSRNVKYKKVKRRIKDKTVKNDKKDIWKNDKDMDLKIKWAQNLEKKI